MLCSASWFFVLLLRNAAVYWDFCNWIVCCVLFGFYRVANNSNWYQQSYSHRKASYTGMSFFITRCLKTHTHTHPFNGPFSGTTQVSRYQKVKPIWILLKQETVSGSGISWAICKSAPCSRQITTTAPPPLCFLQAGCPSCRPTNSCLKTTTLMVPKFGF